MAVRSWPSITPCGFLLALLIPSVNFSCRIVSERIDTEWRRLRGKPHKSWLDRLADSCWEVLKVRRDAQRDF